MKHLLSRTFFTWINVNILSRVPLTFRGGIFLVFGLGILFGYAIPKADLVAAIIGTSVISLVMLCIFGVIISYLNVRHKLSFQLNLPHTRHRSDTNIPVGLILENKHLLPYITLIIDKCFLPNKALSVLHLVRGNGLPGHRDYLIDNVNFPHRGIWSLNTLNMRIEDALGFSALSWTVSTSGVIETLPPINPIKPLPIIASSTKEGEDISLTAERTGDLFDTKQYDPSDGVKRILWKSYARSRTLVVRRPEPAQIPEGEVAIFLVSSEEDDHVAGAVESYIDFLHKNNVKILFGGCGTKLKNHFTSDIEEILSGICASGTSTVLKAEDEFSNYLKSLSENSAMLHRVVVFTSQDFLNNNKSFFDKISSTASSQHISICLVLVPNNFNNYPPKKQIINFSKIISFNKSINNSKFQSQIFHNDQQVIITESLIK